MSHKVTTVHAMIRGARSNRHGIEEAS